VELCPIKNISSKKKSHGQFATHLRSSCRILMGVSKIGRVA
jgi:hypothetical protein